MERKLEVLLVEDDPTTCKEIAEAADMSDDIILVGVTNNSTIALDYIKDRLPDAVILDLELHQGKGSGLTLLHDLNTLSLKNKPYILVTTNNSSGVTYEAVRQLGADFIMYKHEDGYSTRKVLDFLRVIKSVIQNREKTDYTEENASESPEQYKKRILRKISFEINKVGINPKSIGYMYLLDAISIMLKQRTTNIYSVIAKEHGKSESSVERAIQNAINRAWKTTNIEDLLLNYTAKINSTKGSPTNTEFVCYYANKLKNEY